MKKIIDRIKRLLGFKKPKSNFDDCFIIVKGNPFGPEVKLTELEAKALDNAIKNSSKPYTTRKNRL